MTEREKTPTIEEFKNAERILFHDGPTIRELKFEKRKEQRLLMILRLARSFEAASTAVRFHVRFPPTYFKGLVEEQERVAGRPYQSFTPQVEAKARVVLKQAQKFGVK